jgi:predicted Zn-dependent protease
MAITLDMAIFNNIRPWMTQAMVDQMNKSATLVDQLTRYNNEVVNPSGSALPISLGQGSAMNTINGKQQIQLDSNDFWAKGGANWVFNDASGSQHIISREGDFVGVLSHELGHWQNKDIDAARYNGIDPTQPAYGANRAAAGLYGEGEGDYNNWIVRKEILASGGQEIELRGANYSGTGNDLYYLLNQAAISSVADSAELAKSKMSFAGAVAQSHLVTSGNNQNYWEYYKNNGQPAPVSETVELKDYNNDGIIDHVIEHYADGRNEHTFFNTNTPFNFTVGSNDVVNVMSGSVVSIRGDHTTVNVARGGNVTIGGNGQFSSDAHVNTVNVFGTATVRSMDNSRTNVLFVSGNNNDLAANSHVYLGVGNNIGVFEPGGKEVVVIHGDESGNSAIWAGDNASGGWMTIISQNGGPVTISDSSHISMGPYGGGIRYSPASVYVGSNSWITDSNSNTKFYLNGTRSEIDETGGGNTFYNNGTNNYIKLQGNYNSVYNAGQYAYTNAYGTYNHIYNQSSYSFTWTYNGTDTISNTGSNYNSSPTPYDEYWFWGFAGKKAAVDQTIANGATAATALLNSLHGPDGSDLSVSYAMTGLKNVVDLGINTTLTGSRWATTTISWSIKSDEKGAGNNAEYQHVIKHAFEVWEKATGIHFVEAKGSGAADVVVDWKDLDSSHTNALGLTAFGSKDGVMQAGAKIFLEDPTALALVHGQGGTLSYAGTEATLEQVVLHEIGHILGLGTNADLTSIEGYLLSSQNRAISESDLDALYSLYPELGHSPATIVGPTWDHPQDWHIR